MERYTDKIVMITGAGDVALAIAERMLGEGARIAFTDFSETDDRTMRRAQPGCL